jgi:uncharacterized protein (DUF433 family)
MSAIVEYPHLKLGPDGAVRIGSTRYKVKHLAGEHYHYGWTAEELLRQHPDLRPEEVYACLAYFYDHYETIVAELKAEAADISDQRGATHFSRADLLRRKTAAG